MKIRPAVLELGKFIAGGPLLYNGQESQMLHTKFVEISQLVPEKMNFEGFYHRWEWRPSWPCDQHHINKFIFPCT